MIDKELQDHVWKYFLPKEFKEEVKKMHRKYIEYKNEYERKHRKYSANVMAKIICMNTIFGYDNLTSDAEREDEMLTVSRKRVLNLLHSYTEELKNEPKGSVNRFSLCARIAQIKELFDSKCLPDETCNVASSDVASNVASSKSNPSEPKFKDGDIASYVCSPTLKHKCTVTKVMQNEHSGKWEYNVMFEWGKPGMRIPESDLEPYTEPKASTCTETCTEDCSSQCKSQDFDNILKDSFRDHNRLHIAAMIMASMMQNAKWGNKYSHIARMACAAADTLLNEFKKGGMK